jgi:hypothetical protein
MSSSTSTATQHSTGSGTVRQLDGKTALVTGGSSGIGLAAAQRLAAEGAHVFLTGRNQETVDAAVATIGPSATGIRADDVSNVDDLIVVADAIAARGHGLDVIFANAGGGEFTPLGEISAEQFSTRFLVNVGGILFHRGNHAGPAQPRRVDCAGRIHGGLQRNAGIQYLRRNQSGDPFVRADLGRRTLTSRHPGQHCHPRTDRNTRAQGTRPRRTRAGAGGRRGGQGPDELAAAVLFLASD